MFSKEEAKQKIFDLNQKFIEFLSQTHPQYKEAQIEDEFIKSLFKYLNWNVTSEGITNPKDRKFIVQAKGRKGRESDYLLKLDGKSCFYIEAKHSKYYLGGKIEYKGELKEITDYLWQAYSLFLGNNFYNNG